MVSEWTRHRPGKEPKGVGHLIQRRRDRVRPGQGSRSGIFSQIGHDRALEELVDAQIPCPDRATSPAAQLPPLFQV